MATDASGRPPDEGHGDSGKPSPDDKTPSPGKGLDGEGPEGKPKDISQYTDEELEELLQKEEEEELAKIFGPGRYKTRKAALDDFAKQRSDDSRWFNRIKKLAERLKVDPDQLMEHLEKQAGGTKKEEEPSPGKKEPGEDKTLGEIKSIVGRERLNNMFFRFQQQMDRKEVEIPDELQGKLDKLIPAVVTDKSEDELASFNPYPEAYELYLFKLTKGGQKDVEELEEELDAVKALKEKKRRQLKVPSRTTRRATVKDKEEKDTWGDVDKL